MGINKTLLIITFLLLCKIAFCQEFLTPLRCNPLLTKHGGNQQAVTTRSGVVGISDTTLPISDDFSYRQRYPSNKLWMDSEVYIDDNHSVNPPSIGVAVFDGLNKYGLPYDTVPFSVGGADTLTSRPINLRNNSPADSIYFSFFYQQQGYGDPPLSDDTFIVEFRDTLGQWDEVWSAMGVTALTPFRQVLIPVSDLKYFSPGFQFRFRNYATLSGNDNNWLIDYVKMAANRSASDTILHDVAFQYNSQSILKNYTQMPWNQFSAFQNSELRTNYTFIVKNNWNIVNDINFRDSLFNLLHNQGLGVSSGYNFSININPDAINTESFTTFHIPRDIAYLNSVGDSVAEVSVRTHIAAVNGDNNRQNDTIYHNQYFYNYYAYDDGTSDSAYWLRDDFEASKLAYQFTLNKPDILRAVQINFVFANADDSNDIFDVQVWSSLNPETVIYSDAENYSHVLFGDSLTGNGFHTYILSQGVPVIGTFYVGYLQSGISPIYVGFDVNDNDSEKLYYNVGSGWQQSQFHGAVMIRPVLGDSIPPLPSAIAPAPVVKNGSLKVYPNPAKDLLTINVKNTTITDGNISVENILGQTVLTYPFPSESGKSPLGDLGTNETIDVSALPAGMYFLHLADNKGNNTLSTKFVKIN